MESEFTIDAAMQFRDIAAAAAEIIQTTITAFEQLNAASIAACSPMTAIMRAFVRRVEREIVRCWRQLQRQLPAEISHTRYAMRARKMRRVSRGAAY
jgi:hypothetical protein